MISAETPHIAVEPVPLAPPADNLTHVELTYINGHLENWIRFGRHATERIIDRKRRILSFRPNAVFAFVRWASNDFGTAVSRISIVRAVEPGEPYQTLAHVHPGGDILLAVTGWPKVRQVFEAIDAVEAVGVDPCDAAPDHWRHVHNRMWGGQPVRPYTAERHRAWLLRRDIRP
jgi:hypothetical protein